MEHRPFLDIGAVADDDRGIVRPDDSAEPDPDLAPQLHVADQIRRGRDPARPIGGKLRRLGIDFIHRYRGPPCRKRLVPPRGRSEENTSELQSLMRISYAVIC